VTNRDERAAALAVFCDFENVALGVRDARYDELDVDLILERLLDKGKIVVKKAYSDWERYRTSVRGLHEAGFELIEIPHTGYAGKNSADIRLVVDALDLCYTKEHIDVFVVVSGDSDFSPLVSKLRENDKRVIGLGVKNSSSDLLIENCDEFIYYDDLVRHQRQTQKKKQAKPRSASKATVDGGGGDAAPGGKGKGASKGGDGARDKDDASRDKDEETLRQEALDMVLDVVEGLFQDRDDNLWGSMVKQTLKRKRPTFSESFHRYRSFNQLLEDAKRRGLLELQKDDKSGGYIILGYGPKA